MQGYKLGTDIGDKYNQGLAGEAYKDASTQRETEVVSGEDAYRAAQEALEIAKARGAEQGLTPEEITAQYQPTFDALEKDRSREASKQYSIGQGAGFQQGDKQFSRAQGRAAGLQATADVWYGLGQHERGAEAEAKAMGLRKGELELTRAERQESIDQRKEKMAKLWENPEKEWLRRYNENEGMYGQGDHAGKMANLKRLPDGGAIVWHVDKDGQMVGDAQHFSPADVQKEMQKQMLMDMAAADPTNTQLLLEMRKIGVTEEEMASRREFWRGSLNNEERRTAAMETHYSNEAAHQRQQIQVARGNLALLETRHGRESPEYKQAAMKLKGDQDYLKGMGDLAQMIDKGDDPAKIMAKANDLGMQHSDKMPKIKISNGDGTYREEIVNPLAERVKPYVAMYAAEKTAEAQTTYGSDTDIKAVPQVGGTLGWKSRNTRDGKLYTSLGELVKEEGIKPRKAREPRGLTPVAESSDSSRFTHTPSGAYIPSGEPGVGIGGPHLGYPYNLPRR
jgi:hypothetical protein